MLHTTKDSTTWFMLTILYLICAATAQMLFDGYSAEMDFILSVWIFTGLGMLIFVMVYAFFIVHPVD